MLKKQDRKPVEYSENYEEYWQEECICPYCGETFMAYRPKYCPKCGDKFK